MSLTGSKILFVFNGLDLGGAERQALLLARHLQEEKHAQVEFWGFRKPGRASELCDEYGIPWRIVPFRWAYSKVKRIGHLTRFAYCLRLVQPDIVMPYTMLPNVVCGLTWRSSGAQVCVWNQRDEGRDRFQPTIERWAVRLTPWFISNSQHGADFLVQAAGAAPDRVRVVYNGIEMPAPQASRPAWRTRLGVTESSSLVCMVANLTRYKDHATLLRAWRVVTDRLHGTGCEALLLLAGRFDDATDALKALAYDLELGRSVRFLGSVDDVTGLCAASDLAVFSSQLEGIPNGILECMASGLPVVATDIPGIREALGAENAPQLAAPGDASLLAERIVALLLAPMQRQTLGALNRQRVVACFSPQKMVDETVRMLTKIVGSHR